MGLRLDAVERMKDPAFGRDHERGAFDAAAEPAVHHLLLHDAVGRADDFLLVGEKREVEILAVSEAAVALHAVARDARNGVAESFEVGQMVAKALGLERASRSIVLRIEVEHEAATGEGLERDGLAIKSGRREGGRCVARLELNAF